MVSVRSSEKGTNMSLQNNYPISEILSNLTFQTLALGPDDTTESVEKSAHQAISDLLIQARIDENRRSGALWGGYAKLDSLSLGMDYMNNREKELLQQLTSKEK